jgi:hypothetical protein
MATVPGSTPPRKVRAAGSRVEMSGCAYFPAVGNWELGLRVDVFFHRSPRAEPRHGPAPRARGGSMANKARAHDEAWTNAKKICRLTARQVEMASARGMNPRKLPRLRPSPQQRLRRAVGR